MLIAPRQIRAARALLDWTTEDLAKRIGMSKGAISYIETGKNKPSGDTLESLYKVLSREGIVFTEFGVELRDNPIERLEGDHAYLDMLDQIHNLLSGQDEEVLFHCADDRRSSPNVIEKQKQMRDSGIRIRKTIADDNSTITRRLEDYRLIPADYVSSSEVIVIYKDCVVFDLGDALLRIRSEKLTSVWRGQFEYWWKKGKKLAP